ncbi:MAG: IS256 family transposase [Gammaproteobacteria bacterium]|nr:IS256 family transposase [Gammaproteobacteria bacterium]
MAMLANNNNIQDAVAMISERGFDGMGDAMRIIFNQAMLIERENYLQAGFYERNANRVDYANGFKPKTLNTRLGAIEVAIPQTRESDFYPSFLEKGIRSERALHLAMAEMYVQGVSTRKVTTVLESLCGLSVSSTQVSRASQLLDEEFTKWRNRPLAQYTHLFLDALYEKVRQGGSVLDCAILVAYGVGRDGKRTILGVSTALSESEIHWRTFLESLVTRGLHGLESITSDAHSELKAALRAVFPSVLWQRCQFHLQQNAQAYVPKKEMKTQVAEDIRNIFNAPNREEADRLLKMSVEKYAKSAPDLSAWMETNVPEGLAIFHFDVSRRKRLRTSNIAERVNKEIRRRTRVVTIFPSVESCLRLITGVLIEIDEAWVSGSMYINMNN